MDQILILQPLAVLVLVTLLVLLFVPIQRVQAALKNELTLEDFKYGESSQIPDYVKLSNRNLINLFESPILFYVACIVIFITQKTDIVFIYLTWAYVVSRVLHSVIHLTYNKVVHRGFVYELSILVLVLLWLRISYMLFLKAI